MPIIKYENNTGYTWAIWEITESEDALAELTSLNSDEKAELSIIKHPNKRLEFLAGRLVLKEIVIKRNKEFSGIYKDDCGKPHLVNSTCAISLSHSFPLAGAIIHEGEFAGIDIEKPQAKLVKIAPKFLSKEENKKAGLNEVRLCIYWCAKETLYKIYGRRQLLFSENIFVDPFETEIEGITYGQITLPQHKQIHKLRYLNMGSHIICFNI